MRLTQTTFLSLCVAAAQLSAQPTIGSCPVFPADNIWNTPVDQLPVSPSSSTYVNTIGATRGVHADFGAGMWDGGPIGIPFVPVPGSQTKYAATFRWPGESDPGPYAVPLNAPIEGGPNSTGDRHAIAVDIDTCTLYELYRAFPQASSWQSDSGAIFNLQSHSLRPATWTSADAAGLAIFAGLIRFDEILTGEIRHAIRFTVPQTLRAYVWPARHYASSLTDPKYPPMGARFRLRANFDISGYSATNQIILRAMKKYGLMLADNGSAWYISGAPDPRWNDDDLHRLGNVKGSDFEAVDVAPLMISPDSGQARQTTASVSVSPASASVQVNGTRQFTASTSNLSDPAVTWNVNGVVGGNSVVGLINATGLYTAPANAPSPNTVTVRAVSNAAPSVSGSAAVTITALSQPPAVTISPSLAKVRAGRTVQFTATVTNTDNQAVVWKVNGIAGGNGAVGTISSGGLYQAPQNVRFGAMTVSVSATTIATPNATARATVRVTALRR